jgi:hypothetical protein
MVSFQRLQLLVALEAIARYKLPISIYMLANLHPIPRTQSFPFRVLLKAGAAHTCRALMLQRV